jgi:hypothetical protein
VNLSELKKNPKNPRVIRDANFARLKKSIEEFPQMMTLRPIIVDESNTVLGGNMRLEALKALGYKDIPDEWVKRADELTEEQKREFVIKDNSGFGEYDWDALANEWSDLPLADWGADLPEDWLKDADASGTVNEDESDVKELISRADELHKKWKVKRDQVYQVGRHRLMCGDAMSVESVSTLTQGKWLDGICTDPPYDLSAQDVVRAIENFGDVAVVLAADSLAFEIARFWDFRLDFIWRHRKARSFPTKNMPVFFHNHIVSLTRTRKTKLGWTRPRPDFGSIIEIEREFEDNEMGHGKHSELFAEMMAGFKWKTVGDPFVGTAATLLACEASGRTLYGMELEPKTLSVALERVTRAGLSPVLEN